MRGGGRHSPQEPLSLRERFGALKNLPPLFKLVWETSKSLTLANMLFRLLRSMMPVVMLWIGKLIIDEIVRLTTAGVFVGGIDEWFAGGALAHLGMLVLLEFGLAMISDALGRAIALTDSLLGDLFTNKTSVRMMEHAATLDLAHFEDADFQDQMERARRQTSGRMVLVSQIFGQVQDILTIVSFATGLIVFAPWLIVLLIIALIPAFLGEAHFNAKSYSLTYSWTPERRRLDYIRQVGASAETAKEVKVFGLNAFLIERYRTLADAFYLANRSLAVRRASWGTLLTVIGSLGYYGAYVFILYRTAQGAFTIGDLTFLAGSFARLRGLLERLLSSFSTVAGQALYLEDLFAFFAIKPKILTPETPAPFPMPIREGFVFEDVGFKYPGSEKWAVRNLSFSLEAGEAVALVGENGAGKTTLVKLLARLYDPDEGRILLDGIDIREFDLEEFRANIGVIFQDFVRYHLSAGENIAVGRIDAVGDQLRIEHSATQSLADSVIDRLPARYEQVLGRRFKEGVDLSGGEWQKVALGRAYMRDAQLLILDEPTAALDARAEHDVFVRFRELTQGKTAVLISHRFSTVRMADRILVLDQGEILEYGTHTELLAAEGRYAELFELQAAGYR